VFITTALKPPTILLKETSKGIQQRLAFFVT
jgi:hypothetical protein